MTRCCDDEPTLPQCGCDSCCGGDIPVNPFVALRVAYGMLLDEDAFKTMMGNPRGKQMFHSAWLHRSGVIWGYRVCLDGELVIKVKPGAALDKMGRELLLESSMCLDVRDWVRAQKLDGPQEGCRTTTIDACLYVEFNCCPTSPVPTLSNPCDVTRKHDDYSRVVETVKLELRPGPCCDPPEIYHRVRVLLGLDDVGDCDEAGKEAVIAAMVVASADSDRRAQELLYQFRRMAALDEMELSPPVRDGEPCRSLFPALDECAGVVLAKVKIDIKEEGGCTEVVKVDVDPLVRRTLLPTATIQELTCGRAPALLGEDSAADAGGPRVIRESVALTHSGRRLEFKVTAPLVPGSVRRAIAITSLSTRGWVDEDIDTIHYDPDELTVTVHLADRPINPVLRLIVRGTGPTPVYGIDPVVPLAGLLGGPPGSADNGIDAVVSFPNPLDAEEEAS